jgi:hypothetical protein
MNKIKNAYYKVVIGLSNILYYLPLIWEDRSWDYTYNYKFLRVKLEKQRRDILKYSNHENKYKDVSEIYDCIIVLRRLEKDSYVYADCEYKEEDIDLLATYLKKYAGGWWY